MVAFSRDGKTLAGAHSQKVVRLFNAATGERLADLEPPNPWIVTALSFSPDGTQLAVCEGREALHLWDLRYIREELTKMGLDWDLPPYPPAPSSSIPVER